MSPRQDWQRTQLALDDVLGLLDTAHGLLNEAEARRGKAQRAFVVAAAQLFVALEIMPEPRDRVVREARERAIDRLERRIGVYGCAGCLAEDGAPALGSRHRAIPPLAAAAKSKPIIIPGKTRLKITDKERKALEEWARRKLGKDALARAMVRVWLWPIVTARLADSAARLLFRLGDRLHRLGLDVSLTVHPRDSPEGGRRELSVWVPASAGRGRKITNPYYVRARGWRPAAPSLALAKKVWPLLIDGTDLSPRWWEVEYSIERLGMSPSGKVPAAWSVRVWRRANVAR